MLFFFILLISLLFLFFVIVVPYFLMGKKNYVDAIALLDSKDQKKTLLLQIAQLDDDFSAHKVSQEDYQLLTTSIKRRLLTLTREERSHNQKNGI